MDLDTAWTEGPTLSAWVYDSTRGAAAGKLRLDRLHRRGAVALVDAAIVTWVKGAHRPRIGRPHLTTMPRSGRVSPLEVLLAQLLFAHHRIDDSLTHVACALAGTGLTEEFLAELRASFAPDTSALLVLSRRAAVEEVRLVIERGRSRGDVRLLLAPMTREGLARLEAFARTNAVAGW